MPSKLELVKLLKNVWNPAAETIPYMKPIDAAVLIDLLWSWTKDFPAAAVEKAMRVEMLQPRPDFRKIAEHSRGTGQVVAGTALALAVADILAGAKWGEYLDSPFLAKVEAVGEFGVRLQVWNLRYPERRPIQHALLDEYAATGWEWFGRARFEQRWGEIKAEYEGTPDPARRLAAVLDTIGADMDAKAKARRAIA